MSTTRLQCNACQEEFLSHEMHHECSMHICSICYKKNSIQPGQYMYALRLWFWKNVQKKPTDPLPSFWPRYASGTPLSITDILTIAVRHDIDRFPCGEYCSCDYVINRKHVPAITRITECVFYRMNNIGHIHQTALRLYWWYTLYRNNKTDELTPPLSEFWPFENGRPVPPRDMVAQVLQ